MSEFIEIGFWLIVFLAVALRGVANRARQAARSGAGEGTLASEPGGAEERAVAPARPDRRARREPEGRMRGERRPRRERRSALNPWAELAREIERHVEPQPERGGARAEAEEDRTVVVPGRRVFPAEAPSSREAPWLSEAPVRIDPHGPTVEPRARDPVPSARLASRTRVLAPTRSDALDPSRARRPARASGLERLERYDPLKRAVILSEILGTPPGLIGDGPKLGRWDPTG